MKQHKPTPKTSWWLEATSREDFDRAVIRETLRMQAEKAYSIGEQRIVGSVYGRQP